MNLFEGTVSGNSVTLTGVPFADKQGTGLMRVLRITNVRANAAGVELAGAGATPLRAAVSISGATSIGVTNPIQTVAFVQSGAAFTVQCAEPGQPVLLHFAELFPTAFKTQGGTGQSMPGTIYNTESGFTPDLIMPAWVRQTRAQSSAPCSKTSRRASSCRFRLPSARVA